MLATSVQRKEENKLNLRIGRKLTKYAGNYSRRRDIKRVMNKGKTGEKINLITTEEINMNSLPE